MPSLVLALSAAIAASTASHDITVRHRDATYEVSYRPQVSTQMKTVGLSAGTRPSTERCRWAMNVQVERQIRRPGETAGIERLLPETHVIRGQRPGSCAHGRDAIEAEQAARLDTLRKHVEQVADADRAALIADIDSARTLAMN
jgi:hypothetical protein